MRKRGGKCGLIGGFEEGGAGDESIRAGLTAFAGGGKIDATIDFEAEREISFTSPRVDLLKLGQHVGAERLTAEPGLDRHDEHEIDVAQERFDGGGGRVGVEHDAALAAEFTDAPERGGVIVGRLDVDADEVGTGLGEGFDVAVRRVEHQVGIEEGFDAVAAKGGDGLGAEGEIRDKMAVHDIDVQPVEAEFFDQACACGKMRVIAGEDRRDEKRRVHRRRASLPDVENGVLDFAGERFGEERDGLVFGLKLSAVGHGVALCADDAVRENRVAGAAVAERAGRGERKREFPGQTGVGFADGGDIAFEVADDDLKRGVGGFGRAGESDASIALEGVA